MYEAPTSDSNIEPSAITRLKNRFAGVEQSYHCRDRESLLAAVSDLLSFVASSERAFPRSARTLFPVIQWSAEGIIEKASPSSPGWEAIGAAVIFLESFVKRISNLTSVRAGPQTSLHNHNGPADTR